MSISDKIIDIKDLTQYILQQKDLDKKISFCQGHFNVIHPGHLRFLDYVKRQGDCTIVAVQGYNWLDSKNKEIFFDEKERALSVASIERIDKVVIFNDKSILDLISLIKPDVYVRGEEFSNCIDKIQDEINLVEQLGGKVIFSSGQVEYSTSEFLEYDLFDLATKNKTIFIKTLEKQDIAINKLVSYANCFKNKNILVIGDVIVDEYIACDAVGMSAEAPILNIRELESKRFVGGAAVVARHVKALGANCNFVSVVGSDSPGEYVKKELEQDGICTSLFVDNERKTTFKMRYMVGNQKLLRVSRLDEHYLNSNLESLVKAYIKSIAKEIDGIIVSDFAYGIITPAILNFIVEMAKKYNIKLFGDSQSSSQIGDVAKFKAFDLITPTEREARLALGDKFNGLEKVSNILLEKTSAKNMVIKLAEKGFISYQNLDFPNASRVKSQHFPALSVNPIDAMGAGDSLLTGLALSMCVGANLMESSAIAACMASIAVNKVGNIPVKREELVKSLESIQSGVFNG